jgi:ribosome-binding protein aMBF1 (putative translation factor)
MDAEIHFVPLMLNHGIVLASLVCGRTALGLSQKETAHRLGVDPSTLPRWERGEREPASEFAARAERLLAGVGDMREPVRRAG